MINPMILDVVGAFVFMAGFVIGLGAVTVIDLHGLLARRSSYWTEATIRTHKVTKPLIWIGIFLATLGGIILYRNEPFSGIPFMHTVIAVILVLNGVFLSFSVSPFLLKQEKEGRARDLLPVSWQRKIAVSFVLSDVGWWLGLLLLTYYLLLS